MMRLLIIAVLLIASVWIGIQMADSPGYVLIAYKNKSIETTLWFAVIAILALFIVCYLLLRLISNTIHIPRRFRAWRRHKTFLKSQNYTTLGICQLAEGRYAPAENNLTHAADLQTKIKISPMISHLAAANAAQHQGAYERRDLHLNQAAKLNKKSKLAVGLIKAQLQMDSGQNEQALTELLALNKNIPNQPQVINLLSKLYLQNNNWPELLALLPIIKKRKILATQTYTDLETKVYQNLLFQAKENNAETIWRRMPKALRQSTTLILAYTNNLKASNQEAKAAELIKKALKNNWEPELIAQYSQLDEIDPVQQLRTLEKCLPSHSNDSTLLLALGRTCMRNHLWGKARSYLETSVKIYPQPETYQLLGQLHQQLNEQQLALLSYQQGLDQYGVR